MAGRTGVFPGTFNPPTQAHLAIAGAARAQRALHRVVLAVSVRPLGKEDIERPRFEDRLAVLEAEARASGGWLAVEATDLQLISDIASGYDVVIMGADKWAQMQDPAFYGGSAARRDEALARLPELAIAPRPPLAVPASHALDIPEHLMAVSSSAVRAGRLEWMSPAAADLDRRSGAWSDPARYERWRRERPCGARGVTG